MPWLGSVDGSCPYCRRGAENLCIAPTFTGWDRDGGYADFCVVDEGFAYRLPTTVDDEHAAPLLCAGIIGYRAWRSADVPIGGRLGIYGFGGSAHITAQIALHMGQRVHVLTRGEHNQELARSLGVDSLAVRRTRRRNRSTEPSCSLRPGSSSPSPSVALDRGATLAIAGIWLSDVPTLNYERELFEERRLRSVTANTRQDGEEFLALAERFRITPTTVGYPMGRAPEALADLAHGRFGGASCPAQQLTGIPAERHRLLGGAGSDHHQPCFSSSAAGRR